MVQKGERQICKTSYFLNCFIQQLGEIQYFSEICDVVVKITRSGKEQEVTSVGDLPRGPFELTFVSFYGNQQVTDAGLAHFQDCKNLAGLNLGGTKVSDAGR